MKQNFRYMRWATLRQLPLAGIIAVVLTGAAVTAAQIMPVKYEATARLLVEATSVSNDARASSDTSTDAAHLQNIENRVLTLTRLTAIRNQLTTDLSPEDLRDATLFDTISGRGKATTMTISVTSADAEFSTTAANLLAEEVLQEDRVIRTERADAALRFFRQEVTDSRARLEVKFTELFEFKRTQAGKLPEDASRYHDQRDALFAQISATPKPALLSTGQKRLMTELTAARAIYAEQHPLVQALAAKLSKLSPDLTPVQAANPAIAQELTRIDTALSEIPANELTLDTMQRDYDLAEAQYTSAMTRLEAAAIEERIALRTKGDRLSIVERAALPDGPAGPRQKIVLAFGVLLALLIAIGTAVLRARSDTHIRRPKDLEKALDLMPYAVIPQMKPS